jgi:hypothetical protein
MRNDATIGIDEGMKGRGEGPTYLCGTCKVPVIHNKNIIPDHIIIFAKKRIIFNYRFEDYKEINGTLDLSCKVRTCKL